MHRELVESLGRNGTVTILNPRYSQTALKSAHELLCGFVFFGEIAGLAGEAVVRGVILSTFGLRMNVVYMIARQERAATVLAAAILFHP